VFQSKFLREEITHFPVVTHPEIEQVEDQSISQSNLTMFSLGFDLRINEPQLFSILV
jgi:hypothetical protein